MNDMQSLSAFFARPETSTLDTCDQEPIHLSGLIQRGCALLVLDPDTNVITGASENAGKLLGVKTEALISTPLADINQDLAEEIAGFSEDTQILHEVLDFETSLGGVQYDAISHAHAGRRMIEFVPNTSPSPSAVRAKMRNCSKSCARVMRAEDFEEAMQIVVAAARQITGFSRVKIYRFLLDWSGHTIAESRNDAMPSYLGLHFPDTDIPRQVRQIMKIVPYRAIGDVSDETIGIRTAAGASDALDLTWSVIRSVSPMHTAYLRNMGVEATFSCSLMHHGELWGLIAAHNDEPGFVPFDSWNLLHELGTSLMLRYDQQQRVDTADKISGLRRIENRFAAALRQSGDVESVIETLVPILQEFLGADGFAFQYGNTLHTSGHTPPREFIPQMIQWAMRQRETSDQFQTTSLHKEWAPAKDYIDTACGVLIQPIVVHRVCQLIWFRGPITRTVQWAGREAAEGRPKSDGTTGTLGPRQSFDKWLQEHCDESAPWRPSELESAREIFKEFLDIIAAQLLLKEENASLRQFAASAAHDLKAPLRGISMALDIMSEENFDEDVVKQTHAIAQNSANRLSDLTSGLLELAVIREQEHHFASADLGRIAADVREMLSAQVQETGAEITIGALPTLLVNERLMLRLFLNLFGNALKYRDPGRTPRIDISATELPDGAIALAVADNGLGIPAEFAERIFQPMQRLQPQDEVEGSGLGLTICKRIVDVHGGSIHLDADYQGGARFVVSLPEQKSQGAG
ncbi:MAG: GAF domain-containing protein [Rhodobacteraceae bacterium]|nr:GAF domain-containing protein [Paracoccaceae bacterium]